MSKKGENPEIISCGVYALTRENCIAALKKIAPTDSWLQTKEPINHLLLYRVCTNIFQQGLFIS
uniref:Nucleotidyl transferase domain-containing protein n=1 Tax=Aegilops tauschii subsp. strangulata TaxID=200361 RepID=A0A453JRI7_AEGTS